MSSTNERVFIIGGTGNTGSPAVRDLVAKHIPVTLYARTPSKAINLFSNVSGDEALFKVVQGDLSDLGPLKAALPGHTRLLLIAADIQNMVQIKKNVSEAAYAAGIQQIVDVSSHSVAYPWRSTYIGAIHTEAEKALLDTARAHNASLVTLRPTRFMSNLINFDRPGHDSFSDVGEPHVPQGWISPNDIGALAAVVLSEDVKKHGEAVYEMIGDALSPVQRAEVFSRVFGRTITYQQVTPLERYNTLKGPLAFFPFPALYDLSIFVDEYHTVSRGLVILLGREPETFEDYVKANKDAIMD
ncbi:hypothetical protein BC941DRAFT_410195 [Chlamydoabsidia padenii]|nr:hypothetical protein BC941DRAFT_410195 [Chlamydoabsidia padenii]